MDFFPEFFPAFFLQRFFFSEFFLQEHVLEEVLSVLGKLDLEVLGAKIDFRNEPGATPNRDFFLYIDLQ